MSLLSMDNEDFYKPGFFDILVQRKTYTSMLYTLVSIPLYLLISTLLLLIFLAGFLLSPFYIGLTILSVGFKLLWYLSKKEEYIYETYLYSSLPKISSFIPDYRSTVKELVSFIRNKRSWKILIYFLIKPIASILFSIPLFLFIGIVFSMIYTPIKSIFGHISFYGLYETDSFIEVIFIYFICFILSIGFIHCVLYTTKLSFKITKSFLCR